jgi:hypothetical protein
MTNRTLQFLGRGYGSTPATVIATLDGVTIYTGEVPTLDQETILELPGEQVVMFTTEIPLDFTGNKAFSMQVTSGTVNFADQLANYALAPNPVFSPTEFAVLTNPASTPAELIAVESAHATPPFTAADITALESMTDLTDPAVRTARDALLAEHGVTTYAAASGPDVYGDINPNGPNNFDVTIDGVPMTYPDPNPYVGSWYQAVGSGSILAATLVIYAGWIQPA